MAWTTLDFTAFQTLTATQMDQLVANTEGLRDGTLFTAGAIKPVALHTGLSSTTWAWQSYTPVFTNLTVGNGTLAAKYIQIGKTVIVRSSLTFGSTTAVSGDITFTLPVTAATHAGSANITPVGSANLYDASFPRVYHGIISINSTTQAVLRAQAADTSWLYSLPATSANPFTWTTSDEIGFSFVYEAA